MLGILKADGRKIPLGDGSVQCVVTSPPYWGLRKYAGEQELVWGGREDCEHSWEQKSDNAEGYTGRKRWQHGATRQENPAGWSTAIREHGTCQFCGAWRGAYGLEPTVEMYVKHTVKILRETRRVLRDDGVVFWNIGDSYCGYWGDKKALAEGRPSQADTQWTHGFSMNSRPKFDSFRHEGIKPKDLCLIPFRVALAAQADGWWVRSDIIWAKPNPMPESVTDRPTDAYEHILMLTKRARYYWDARAVREDGPSYTRKAGGYYGRDGENASRFAGKGGFGDSDVTTNGRNLRNVWEFPTQSYAEAHFATFPEELPKRCILAATSAKGACAKCGTPWERVVDRSVHPHPNRWSKTNDAKQFSQQGNDYGPGGTLGVAHQSTTVGWWPTCSCGGYGVRSVHSRRLSRHSWYRQHWQGRIEFKWPKTIPCLTLDPFAGSGTVGKVAIELGRRAILCDLAYQDLASRRTAAIQRPLLAPAEAGWRE